MRTMARHAALPLRGGCVVAIAICAMGSPAVAGAFEVAPTPDVSGLNDFDFEVGEWRVQHRYLKQLPDGRREWVEYPGTSRNHKIMDGLANIEENVFFTPQGVRRGVAIRSYDRATGAWAIWWLDERYPHGQMDPPVVGRFTDGVGTFYSDGIVNGKPTRTRFIWSHITPTSARWEQAFSHDAGATWEPNWIMAFSRSDRAADTSGSKPP